jgi:hypothetical protein
MANIFSLGTSRRILRILFDGLHHWDSLNPAIPEGYFPGGMQIVYVQFLVTAGGTMRIRDGSPVSEASILEAMDIFGEGKALSLRDLPRVFPCVNANDVVNGDVLILAFK